MTAQYEVGLLNRWRLFGDDIAIHFRLREQRVLTLLAINRSLSRRRVSGILWPETTECRAADSLRVSLFHIHHQAPGLVECAEGWLQLAQSTRIDLRLWRARMEDLLTDLELTDQDCEFLSEGSALLPEWDEEWLQRDQDSVHRLRMCAMETVAQNLLVSGRFDQAGNLARAALEYDPLCEAAANILAWAQVCQGKNATALTGLIKFVHRLRLELDVEPSSEITSTLAILRGTQPSQHSASRTMLRTLHALP